MHGFGDTMDRFDNDFPGHYLRLIKSAYFCHRPDPAISGIPDDALNALRRSQIRSRPGPEPSRADLLHFLPFIFAREDRIGPSRP